MNAIDYRVGVLEKAYALVETHRFKGAEFRENEQKELLKDHLLGRDPLAMLAYLGLENVKEKQLLAFENTFPGVKHMNDVVFKGDHALMDLFMDRVEEMIRQRLSTRGIDPVHFSVKGGFILMPNDLDKSARSELLDEFERFTNETLRQFLYEQAERKVGEYEHYVSQAAFYRDNPMNFTYAASNWPEGELTLEAAAKTVALTTGKVKYAVSRRGRREMSTGTSDEKRTEDADRREIEVIEMSQEEYVAELKLGLRHSFTRARAIYERARNEGNSEQLKAFEVDEENPNTLFTLFSRQAFSALRKGEFDHEILNGFTDQEKQQLNAYRKAVNSMDAITAYTRDSKEGYFKSIEVMVQAIRDENLPALKNFARVSHKDETLHEKDGQIDDVTNFRLTTNARMAEVMKDEIQDTDGLHIVNLDIINFGYTNHLALSRLVPSVLTESDPDKVLDLLACPLHHANVQLNDLRRSIAEEIEALGHEFIAMIPPVLNGEGGDEFVIVYRPEPGKQWTAVQLNGGAVRVASYEIDGCVPPEKRLEVVATAMSRGDTRFNEIKSEWPGVKNPSHEKIHVDS